MPARGGVPGEVRGELGRDQFRVPGPDAIHDGGHGRHCPAKGADVLGHPHEVALVHLPAQRAHLTITTVVPALVEEMVISSTSRFDPGRPSPRPPLVL